MGEKKLFKVVYYVQSSDEYEETYLADDKEDAYQMWLASDSPLSKTFLGNKHHTTGIYRVEEASGDVV